MIQKSHICYGLLGLPLAMASLPLYVQLPSYYTQQLGLPMAAIGYVLFFTRILDTVQDPFLGLLINRIKAHHPFWYVAGAVLMASAFAGLWMPPSQLHEPTLILAWIAAMLFIAYSAHSMLNIAYLSWGAALGQNESESGIASLLGAASWREACGLCGVILASIAPAFILVSNVEQRNQNLVYYSLFFASLLTLALLALLRGAKKPKPIENEQSQHRIKLRDVVLDLKVRPLFVAYLINSLAVALPASLMLFFVDQQIGTSDKLPQFLVSYFLSGAIGLPVWLFCAKKFGCRIVWQVSLLISIAAFVGAAFLGKGDATLYTVICITSGLCLGADLVLPPVLLSQQIGTTQSQASYFGVWTFLGKIALASSGLSLPLLDFLQKSPDFANLSQGLIENLPLVFCYALIPCTLKILAFICLIDSQKRITS